MEWRISKIFGVREKVEQVIIFELHIKTDMPNKKVNWVKFYFMLILMKVLNGFDGSSVMS